MSPEKKKRLLWMLVVVVAALVGTAYVMYRSVTDSLPEHPIFEDHEH